MSRPKGSRVQEAGRECCEFTFPFGNDTDLCLYSCVHTSNHDTQLLLTLFTPLSEYSIIGRSGHRYHFCRDKKTTTQKHVFVATKHVFVATKVLWRQTYFCRNNTFVVTNICRDKYNFVATKHLFCRDKFLNRETLKLYCKAY